MSLLAWITRFQGFPFKMLSSSSLSKNATLSLDADKSRRLCVPSNYLQKVHLHMEATLHYKIFAFLWFVPVQHFCLAVQLLVKSNECELFPKVLCHCLTLFDHHPDGVKVLGESVYDWTWAYFCPGWIRFWYLIESTPSWKFLHLATVAKKLSKQSQQLQTLLFLLASGLLYHCVNTSR